MFTSDTKTEIKETNPLHFDGTDLINSIAESVMNDEIKQDVLQHLEKGRDTFVQFVADCIISSFILWGPKKKLKLQIWRSAGKTLKTTMKKIKVVERKETNPFFARMAVITRSHPEIDMEEAIGTYELCCAPQLVYL